MAKDEEVEWRRMRRLNHSYLYSLNISGLFSFSESFISIYKRRPVPIVRK